MAKYGFELSEKLNMPVLLRFVTRLSHSRAVVEIDTEPDAQNNFSYPAKARQWVLMPAVSKQRNKQLIKDWDGFVKASEKSPFNRYEDAPRHEMGIIASGVAYNYLQELYNGEVPFPVVKISQYPLPVKLIRQLYNSCDSIMILEEGQPFIEKSIRGILDTDKRIYGKLSGEVQRDGELSPDSVKDSLINVVPTICRLTADKIKAVPEVVVSRPPALCQGCGHRDVYGALNEALSKYEDSKVFGDIGCYTLGFLKPFNAIDTVVDMGASITMAKGAADAGQRPSVAIIGDSTFTHSGMTGLLDAINENTPMTVIISDNLTTGMTGGQDSQGTGKIEEICLGLGAHPDHVRTIDSLPKNHDEMVKLFSEEIDYEGLSVIVSRRECIQTARRHAAKK